MRGYLPTSADRGADGAVCPSVPVPPHDKGRDLLMRPEVLLLTFAGALSAPHAWEWNAPPLKKISAHQTLRECSVGCGFPYADHDEDGC